MTRFTRAALATAALTLATAGAQAITLVGLTSAGQLARIDTGNIAGATTTAITGLAAGDRLVGIDQRPKDGKIYGISLSNQLYTINEMTGTATQVAMLATPAVQAGLGYGIDFNPVADFGTGASLRLVSSAGGNFAVNAGTGGVTTATSIAAGYTAVAYTNSMPMPTAAPASTALYYINTSTDMLMMAPSAFNNPTISAVGALGVDALRANGFEIANGMGYAALNLDDGTLGTGLYGINLATGGATLLGNYNGTLTGLTVSAVPEPQTYALMLAGLVAVGALARRRKV
ncbi:DUF4394 domain-containing protein [Pseudaquabacterium pictum]|uniref:PEP-CTERM protein-sorting domain-containing protein n=1 Tax=Pseudaquabacterium pictum TaxID=2315236 RepID=A0A480AKD8_9BURK|nr:DUF4394 domain-containing protein [Rubrivivax pictus]GCL62199.1 hypothetical protein AQPW35_12800 [Rubrivivax pictus]